jgi:preprotein translocase subunit SecG
METLVLVIHVLAALGICGLVLLQHGKGADVGAAFGGGASGSLFGSTGAANFLSRATAAMAAVFFLTSMGLTYFSTRKPENKGVMATQPAPAKPGPAQVPGPGIPAGQPSIKLEQPQGAPGAAPDPGSKAREVPK